MPRAIETVKTAKASCKSMQLKTVLDSQGVAVGQNVDDYRKALPEND